MTDHPPPVPPTRPPAAAPTAAVAAPPQTAQAAPPQAPPPAPRPESPPTNGNGPSEARIYDRGYRRYDGDRTGVEGSVRSLVRHSVRTALGMGRSARYKVLPVFIIITSYLPVVGIIGFVALLPIDPEEFVPSYADYYGFVTASIYLFAGLIGPQLLCNDRRNGLLGVYLAAALNRPLYLLGKAIAVVLLLLLVTLGPPLLLLLALTLQGQGPDGVTEWVSTFLEILLSSVVIGAIFAALSLAVAATTDRLLIASATVLAIIPGSTIVTATLVDGIDLSPHIRLLDLLVLPQALIYRIQDEAGVWPVNENPTWTMVVAWFAWVAVCLAWIWFRYRRLLVRR